MSASIRLWGRGTYSGWEWNERPIDPVGLIASIFRIRKIGIVESLTVRLLYSSEPDKAIKTELLGEWEVPNVQVP
jgi:hypothetical protein